MNAISLYIPCPDRSTARAVASHLLKKRLIACSNIFPIDSMYWWKGKLEVTKEHAIIAKSLKNQYSKILKETRKVHPYEVPLIAMSDVETNKEYLKWLIKETRK